MNQNNEIYLISKDNQSHLASFFRNKMRDILDINKRFKVFRSEEITLEEFIHYTEKDFFILMDNRKKPTFTLEVQKISSWILKQNNKNKIQCVVLSYWPEYWLDIASDIVKLEKNVISLIPVKKVKKDLILAA